MTHHFFEIDPLSEEFFQEFETLDNFVLLEELKIVQNSLHSCLLPYATNNYADLTNYEKWENCCKISVYTHVEQLANILDLLRIDVQKTLFERGDPNHTLIIAFDMFQKIISNFGHLLWQRITEYQYESLSICPLYCIMFLQNIAIYKKIKEGCIEENPEFWLKSAILSFESFNCGNRISIISLCSSFEQCPGQVTIQSEDDNVSWLASDRATLMSQEYYQAQKKAVKKDEKEYGAARLEAKKFYEENPYQFKNKAEVIEGILTYLEKNKYFGSKRISKNEAGQKTIGGWIDSWKEDSLSDSSSCLRTVEPRLEDNLERIRQLRLREVSCKKCGSADLKRNGSRSGNLSDGTKARIQRYKCKSEKCGHVFLYDQRD